MFKIRDECLFVCVKTNGCNLLNTHKIGKINSLESYEKLNPYFD